MALDPYCRTVVSQLETPDWLITLLDDSPNGGWFFPVQATADHPVVSNEWRCLTCQSFIEPNDIVFFMPLSDGPDSCWTVLHRSCVLRCVGAFEPPDAPRSSDWRCPVCKGNGSWLDEEGGTHPCGDCCETGRRGGCR